MRGARLLLCARHRPRTAARREWRFLQRGAALGAFDGVIVFDAPDETTATAAMLHLSSLGNIQTQTTRAFDAAEMQKIVGLMQSGPKSSISVPQQ